MSIRLSLLAILDQGPCYGHQLRGEFDRRTGSIWPLNAGQVYTTLDRLERDGLVTKSDSDTEGQIHYTITSAGSQAVAAWFDSPVLRSGAARDELAIKLALATTLLGVDAVSVIRVQREATLAALRELEDAEADESGEHVSRSLVVDSLVFAAEAEVRWLHHAQERLDRAAASGLATALPISTETPRRGRPARPRS